jgi:hypothetical protein
VGVGFKIQAGVMTANPILLLSAGADVFILAQNFDQVREAISSFWSILNSKFARSAYVGAASGVTAVGVTTTAVGFFGTASTGTAIATLSGAAATKATLAAIGGGALAAGGLGIVGGVGVLALIALRITKI